MSTNPKYSEYGGASSPSRGTGVYTGRITLIYDDGRVRVFINMFGRNIGPCRIINKSAGDAISLNDEVLCTYANDTSDELIVVGRLTERVDPVSESTSGLVVEATTSSELVRITQKGTGAALLVEDSTNPDSTPFIIDASGNVGIGQSSPSAKLDISGAAVISGDLTVDTTTLKVDSTNNRVGIGTVSPLVALDVVGEVIARNAVSQDGVRLAGRAGGTGYYDVALIPTTLSADRTLTLPNVSGTAITTGNLSDITSTGTLSSLIITGDLTVDTNTLKLDSTNNRVGINTTSPVTALDVTGTITARTAAAQDGVALAGRAGGTGTYEVTITPTTLSADRTLTLPNTTGTVVTTGDSGTVTSTMILDGTIVNGDINASAAIADTKLATISTASKVSNSATTATSSNTASAIVARDSSGNFTAGTITATTFSGGLASSNLTGQTGMWTSAGRPGATRLYRNDYDDEYNVQTYWTGSRWRLYGYYGSTAHADTHVGYADSSGFASSTSGGGGGIAYPGATVGGGAANNIGFRWANPSVNCTVDNVISAEAANFSDRRLKTNIVTYTGGLDAARNLRPVKFNPLDIMSFTDDGEPIIGDNDPYDEMIGFIADEMQEVIPSAISGTGNQLKSVSVLQVVSVAVSAIKELDAKVTSLTERIEALESK